MSPILADTMKNEDQSRKSNFKQGSCRNGTRVKIAAFDSGNATNSCYILEKDTNLNCILFGALKICPFTKESVSNLENIA